MLAGGAARLIIVAKDGVLRAQPAVRAEAGREDGKVREAESVVRPVRLVDRIAS